MAKSVAVRSASQEYTKIPSHRNSTQICHAVKQPPKKGSFSSKFSDDNSKIVAYVIENTKIVDRTTNAILYLLDIDFTLSLHKHTSALSAAHITAGIYDYLYGEGSPYSSAGSLFYAINANSDYFAIDNTLLKCTLEGSYALLRGYPSIPSLFTPSADLIGALINFSLCINREENTGEYRKLIDSSLKFVKGMLQAQNPVFHAMVKLQDPSGILLDMYQTGNILGDMKKMWSEQDPALINKALAYIKAAWNLVDIKSEFHPSSNEVDIDGIENTTHIDEKTALGDMCAAEAM